MPKITTFVPLKMNRGKWFLSLSKDPHQNNLEILKLEILKLGILISTTIKQFNNKQSTI